MNEVFQDLVTSFLISWSGCALLAWLMPVRRAPFGRYMQGRLVRVLGRVVLVLVWLAVAIRCFGWHPAAVTVGVLGGWLLASSWEAWRFGRAGDHRK